MARQVARNVDRVLQQDPVVREALQRGFVNLRALARWMIHTKGLEASEDAVLSAIRRHQSTATGNGAMEDARQAMRGAHVNMRSNMAVAALSKSRDIQAKLPRLFDAVDYTKGEVLRIIQSERSIKVVVDEAKLESIVAILGGDQVDAVQSGLAELHVVLPPEGERTPGIGGLMLLCLGMRGINIAEVITGLPEALILVDQKDALNACDALIALIDESRASVGPTNERDLTAADAI